MEARLLGVAQDGGFPQPGCMCANCQNQALLPSAAACLAIVDEAHKRYWLIDAPPQFGEAIRPLAGLKLEGVLLTHGHIGHYTGLAFLGKEAMASRQVPVWCSRQMRDFLESNEPWASLIMGSHIEIHEVSDGQSIRITPDLHITPVAVEHRGEFTDTFAFFIQGPDRSLLYCPDIDRWPVADPRWDTFCQKCSELLADATFYSPDELPGRDLGQIPHPFVVETLDRLAPIAKKTTLIHLNHSNPLFDPGSPQSDVVRGAGFRVGSVGQRFRFD